MVPVAQLVRASVCGTEGRGFKSHQAPHYNFQLLRNDSLKYIANKVGDYRSDDSEY